MSWWELIGCIVYMYKLRKMCKTIRKWQQKLKRSQVLAKKAIPFIPFIASDLRQQYISPITNQRFTLPILPYDVSPERKPCKTQDLFRARTIVVGCEHLGLSPSPPLSVSRHQKERKKEMFMYPFHAIQLIDTIATCTLFRQWSILVFPRKRIQVYCTSWRALERSTRGYEN